MQRTNALILGALLLIAFPASGSSVGRTAPIAQDTPPQAEAPLGSAFTYQGQLTKAGEAVSDACRMTFRLFDAQNGGAQLGDAQVIDPVQVTNGIFTVVLNGNNQFGPAAFDGQERWLQITVRCPGDDEGVILPRQRLTAAPYAITSLSTERLQGRPVSAAAPAAGQVLAWDGSAWTPQNPAGGSGPTDWNSLTNVPAGFADGVDNDSGGDITAVNAGTGLTGGGDSGDVTLGLDTGVTDNLYWQLDGNSGTDPTTHFLGTTDDAALTLKANNRTALRVIPGPDGGTNWIGGHEDSSVAPDVDFAFIGTSDSGSESNRVTGDYGVVVGGAAAMSRPPTRSSSEATATMRPALPPPSLEADSTMRPALAPSPSGANSTPRPLYSAPSAVDSSMRRTANDPPSPAAWKQSQACGASSPMPRAISVSVGRRKCPCTCCATSPPMLRRPNFSWMGKMTG